LNAPPPDKRTSLADLAREFVGTDDDAASAVRPPASKPTAEVELSLEDLISDDNGEIVFFNDSGFRTLSITTQSSVVSNGRASQHSTASGEDVSGFNYVTFANGMTLYFEEGLDLLVP
jgi:hypothetical protein